MFVNKTIRVLKVLLVFLLFHIADSSQAKVTFLDPGELVTQTTNFQIYCYRGKPKSIVYLWQTISIEIDLLSDNYVYYEGSTPEIVNTEYLEKRSSWGFNLFSWKQKHFKLNPFNQSCIGIESKELYHVLLNVLRVDYWKVLLLLLGALLFFSAGKLSSNVLFYYICGISLGICTSFLILIYFLSKLFPQKPMMYGIAIGGWTIGVYLLQKLWENIRVIFIHYQSYVIWYAIITGVISFIFCYRWGPVTNDRTKNLIRWSLQGLGLVGVFHSSQFQEAAMGQIVIIILVYNFPKAWLSKSKTFWKRKFPPKTKLLTNTEYYQQGVLETSKALDELRNFCSSPKCNQWNTALKLKNVKRHNDTFRFASFVEGNSHLSDEEILEYETALHSSEITDDEDDTLTDED